MPSRSRLLDGIFLTSASIISLVIGLMDNYTLSVIWVLTKFNRRASSSDSAVTRSSHSLDITFNEVKYISFKSIWNFLWVCDLFFVNFNSDWRFGRRFSWHSLFYQFPKISCIVLFCFLGFYLWNTLTLHWKSVQRQCFWLFCTLFWLVYYSWHVL